MSIDERLRTGLVRNTEHLVPDIEQELATTYRRAHERRLRRGGLALAAAAAVATVILWYGDVPALRDAEPVGPDPAPRSATDLQGVDGPLDPGTYSLTVWGETETSLLPRAIVEVPEGWYSHGGWTIDSGNTIGEPEQIGQISVWRVAQVFTDPCRLGTGTDPGESVADLARALTDQDGPSTRPRPTVLDGHRGLALDVTIPPARDRTTCTDTRYSLWRATGGGGLHIQDVPGVVNHLRILDVDGIPLVVVVTAHPDQPNEQPEDLLAVAETITFGPPDS